jgi:hypothetical protein
MSPDLPAAAVDLTSAAVRENAGWCDLVCRLNGVRTLFGADFWSASDPPPLFYPSGITLHRGMTSSTIDLLLARAAPGGIKDSYADIELSSRGYAVLFSAQWIAHEPPPRRRPAPSGWATVDSAAALADWSVAHGSVGVFPSGLLAEPSVRVLALCDEGRVVAGAIAHRSADVIGVSNVFGKGSGRGGFWSRLLLAVGYFFPALPVVGYEGGAELAAAVSAGFMAVGRLRVWQRAALRP